MLAVVGRYILYYSLETNLQADGERPVRQGRDMRLPRHNLVDTDCIVIHHRIEYRAMEM